MQRSVEGVILSKYPYGERHLICHLLLRNGSKVSIIFMGGRGGGKKHKPGVLELGYLIKVELRRMRSTADLFVAKEWSLGWVHQNIRFHYRAFEVMCFFLELVGKIAVEEDLHAPSSMGGGHERTFGTLANGLFYLEERTAAKQFSPTYDASLFVSKLLMAQGVFPVLRECVFCGINFGSESAVTFVPEQGGFACTGCDPRQQGEEGGLWQFLRRTGGTSYKELAWEEGVESLRPGLLLSYFCYQFHLDIGRIKTGGLLR